MSAPRAGIPPGTWARAPRQGPGNDEQLAGGTVAATVTPASQKADRSPVETYVQPLIAAGYAVGDVPILGSPEWCRLDRRDPRSTASICRAALAWYGEGLPEIMAEQLRRELAESDWLVRYRIRQAGLDVHGRGSTDWTRIHEVVTNRAEYRERWGVPA